MKITDPDVIKNGEKDLIEAVMDDLDMEAVQKILKKKMAAAALSSRGGEIIVHNNEIAYRLDFDIKLSGSLMFDRQGNYISASDEADPEKSGESEQILEADDPEDLISEDFDLEDINIDETLEEVTPQTLLKDNDLPEDTSLETEDAKEPVEEALNIDLPDYDFEDELNPEEGEMEIQQTLKNDDSEMTSDNPDPLDDDLADDDMNDILQESRDFWDQKKDS